jgi:hypothetical protein
MSFDLIGSFLVRCVIARVKFDWHALLGFKLQNVLGL